MFHGVVAANRGHICLWSSRKDVRPTLDPTLDPILEKAWELDHEPHRCTPRGADAPRSRSRPGGGSARRRPRDHRQPRFFTGWRTQVRSRFHELRVRQPGRAQGWRGQVLGLQLIRHAEPLYAQGAVGGRHHPDFREADGGCGGRTVVPLWPDRRDHGISRGFLMGDLQPSARGTLARRHADHGG